MKTLPFMDDLWFTIEHALFAEAMVEQPEDTSTVTGICWEGGYPRDKHHFASIIARSKNELLGFMQSQGVGFTFHRIWERLWGALFRWKDLGRLNTHSHLCEFVNFEFSLDIHQRMASGAEELLCWQRKQTAAVWGITSASYHQWIIYHKFSWLSFHF